MNTFELAFPEANTTFESVVLKSKKHAGEYFAAEHMISSRNKNNKDINDLYDDSSNTKKNILFIPSIPNMPEGLRWKKRTGRIKEICLERCDTNDLRPFNREEVQQALDGIVFEAYPLVLLPINNIAKISLNEKSEKIRLHSSSSCSSSSSSSTSLDPYRFVNKEESGINSYLTMEVKAYKGKSEGFLRKMIKNSYGAISHRVLLLAQSSIAGFDLGQTLYIYTPDMMYNKADQKQLIGRATRIAFDHPQIYFRFYLTNDSVEKSLINVQFEEDGEHQLQIENEMKEEIENISTSSSSSINQIKPVICKIQNIEGNMDEDSFNQEYIDDSSIDSVLQNIYNTINYIDFNTNEIEFGKWLNIYNEKEKNSSPLHTCSSPYLPERKKRNSRNTFVPKPYIPKSESKSINDIVKNKIDSINPTNKSKKRSHDETVKQKNLSDSYSNSINEECNRCNNPRNLFCQNCDEYLCKNCDQISHRHSGRSPTRNPLCYLDLTFAKYKCKECNENMCEHCDRWAHQNILFLHIRELIVLLQIIKIFKFLNLLILIFRFLLLLHLLILLHLIFKKILFQIHLT